MAEGALKITQEMGFDSDKREMGSKNLLVQAAIDRNRALDQKRFFLKVCG